MSDPTARQIAEILDSLQSAVDDPLGGAVQIGNMPARDLLTFVATLTADLAQAKVLAETRLAHCTSVDKQLDKRDADLAQARQEIADTRSEAHDEIRAFQRLLAEAKQARDAALADVWNSAVEKLKGHAFITRGEHVPDTQAGSIEDAAEALYCHAARTALLEAAEALEKGWLLDGIVTISNIAAWLRARAGEAK